VGVIVGVDVFAGRGVIVAVAVTVGDGTGDAVGVIDCLHAARDTIIVRNVIVVKKCLMFTHFYSTNPFLNDVLIIDG